MATRLRGSFGPFDLTVLCITDVCTGYLHAGQNEQRVDFRQFAVTWYAHSNPPELPLFGRNRERGQSPETTGLRLVGLLMLEA